MPDFRYIEELAEYLEKSISGDAVTIGLTDAEAAAKVLRLYATTRPATSPPPETPEVA